VSVKDAPSGAKVFKLVRDSKRPATKNGHLDARPVGDEYVEGNYGISLDRQFLLVDVDSPEKVPDSFLQALPDTWTQKTRRGTHFLYAVPEDFVGTNAKIPGNAGDIKCRGYLVGPGSKTLEKGEEFVYHIVDSQQPVVAPDWLMSLVLDKRPAESPGQVQARETSLQIGEGEGRNQFLTRVAGSLRGLGLGVAQAKTIVRSVNASTCVPPVDEAELRQTIDKSIEKWQQGEVTLDGPFVPSGWTSAADVPTVREPVRWWVWGFVPKAALVLNYGPGGIGKSTFAAWLAGEVTRKGGRFGVVTREDPFELFVDRARLSGVDESLLFGAKSGDMSFPKDAARLQGVIEELKLDFLYFDAIYDHFETKEGFHAGERTRQALSSLAKIAGECGCTIMGTFHTNKSGEFMGSTEMENVSRVLLKATRGDAPDSPLAIHVRKSNFKRPDFSMRFLLEESSLVDRETGEMRQEEARDGSLVTAKLSYAKQIEDQQSNTAPLDSFSELPSVAARAAVLEMLGCANDTILAKDLNQAVSELTDAGLRTIKRAVADLVDSGEVIKEGENRFTMYKLAPGQNTMP
jgi:hypothetical protein